MAGPNISGPYDDYMHMAAGAGIEESLARLDVNPYVRLAAAMLVGGAKEASDKNWNNTDFAGYPAGALMSMAARKLIPSKPGSWQPVFTYKDGGEFHIGGRYDW